MESTPKESSEETFLKIDTIWSEAEDNFESIAIKEEIVSDLEPELSDSNDRNSDWECSSNAGNQSIQNEKNSVGNVNSSSTLQWQTVKKKIKNKNLGFGPEEFDNSIDLKSCCLHDTKSFKIVNRRLRCGDCRSLVCPECFKIMFSTLHNHFLGFDTNNCSVYFCKFCCFPFQSICALQAHIRIHTMETPYVCPDCGLIYSNAYFLILHLINKCYHVYKSVSYKCLSCPGICFTTEQYLQHIQENHLNCIFRCSYCSLLFNSIEELHNHMSSNHQKQKVQYLKYFRCTLCSDSVIPSFMFEKHIERHRENSESYEVEYRCLCGDVYHLIGAFRAHIQFCDKKGILPPHWGFLQKNLKTQDVISLEMSKGKESTSTLSTSLQPFSSLNNDCQFIKLTLRKNTDHKSECSSSNQLLIKEIGSSTKLDDRKESSSLLDIKKDSSQKNDDTVKINNTSLNKSVDNFSSINMSSSQAATSIKSQQNEDTTKTDLIEDKNSTQKTNIQPEEEKSKEFSGENADEKKRISSERDSDLPKIFYDYIPCDHLGYVKTQGPKPNETEPTIVEEKIESPSKGSNNYHVTMELDEKTGLLVSKKIESLDDKEEEGEENLDEKDNFCDKDTVNFNYDDSSQTHANEKGKVKGGNSFFTCPFCIVLFPKHSSTFQQFKLHLEYYHTDAALNITVSRIKNDENSVKQIKTKENNFTNEEKKSSRKTFYKNQCGPSIRNKSIRKKKKNIELKSVDKEYALAENEEVTNNINTKEAKADESQIFDEDEKENLTKQRNKVDKKCSSVDVYWTVKLSVKNNEDLNDKKKQPEKISSSSITASFDSVEKTKQFESTEEVEKTKFCSGLNQESELKTVAVMRKSNGNSNEKIVVNDKESTVDSKNINDKESNHILEIEGNEWHKNLYFNANDSVCVKKEKVFSHNNSAEKKLDRAALDFDEDWESSKDSSWSNASDIEAVSHRNGNTDLSEVISSKPKVTEKIKRESEVWSEFYESLQLAEKLKKSKKKKSSSLIEPKVKLSTLADYSSKRVVKKPKRYRESSESEFSLDENDNCESDSEFVIGNDSQGYDNVEVNGTNNIHQYKKQKLLNKLENVDQKFLDYLFDLINRKEKCIELYKKHSRVNRYSQDLKTYRKKVLNGIKIRGRSLELLRYHDMTKKDDSVNEKLQALKEIGCQRTPKKISENPENKTGEKKRGRPRKIIETGKLKERRRSDKEVDFIEKNFEREESGCSPSKRKRKLSSKLQYYKKINQPDEKDDFSCGQLITNKSIDVNKKFSCAICKEVFPELIEFREHIIQHRLEENTYQCMECGECFVVRPSLEKHLHAFHKIKNTDRYITENQCCNSKKEIAEAENEPLKENQCKVCKDQFERAIDLTKHFRIHGMAFLKEFRKDSKIKL